MQGFKPKEQRQPQDGNMGRDDADLRRTTRHDMPHHNLAAWP